ncbi:MAG: PDC sensor domain-containing protein [bacterium]
MTDHATQPHLTPLQARIQRQRALLHNLLLDPMQRSAVRCAKVWDNKEELDQALLESLQEMSYCTFMYAIDPDAKQISANASQNGPIEKDFGRDRSSRPYWVELDHDAEMHLSDAYISLQANRPSVTALQKVHRDGELIGYIGADFDLRYLPITQDLYTEPGRWRQIKGDPVIRGQVFQQNRIQSRLDGQLDLVMPVLEELMLDNGVFHAKVHFSSSRATLWFIDDPFRYQILEFEDIVDPDICLAFPHRPYPEDAMVPADAIAPILQSFRKLRTADDTIYLRAGSVNIFNGLVGLNFSCDGSHYIPYDQFLSPESAFWEGME